MSEKLVGPGTPADDEQANVLPNGAMLLEGTEVPVVADRPVAPISRLKRSEPQSETLFPVPETPRKQPRRTRPVRGRLAMFADAGRIPQHELDRKAGRETQEPLINPDADIDEIFGAPEAKRTL
jgi:hypothetical protein